MKKILTSQNCAAKPKEVQYGIMFFIIITITVTLINSPIFIYAALSSYFLYTSSVAILILLTGVLIIQRKGFALFSFTYPVALFIIWNFYVLINGWLKDSLNLTHLYFFFNGAFFLVVFKFSGLLKTRSTTFFFILGILSAIEAIVCLLQFGGFLSAMNHYFTATGTWSNPNVTAMFLAMVVPAVVSLIIYNQTNRKAAIFILLMIVIALILLKCRTAFIGAGVGGCIVLNFKFRFTKQLLNKLDYTRAIVMMFSLVVIISASWNLYNIKKDSADGRKLIWKLSLAMVKEKPVTGYGYGLFEREYNLYQTNYFKGADQAPDELKIAGHVNMGYNEFLQNAVEGGLIGFMMLLFLMLALLSIPKLKPIDYNKNTDLQEDVIYVAAYAGIAAFGVMSMVNFTVQAIPVMAIFILYAAILATNPAFKRYRLFRNNRFPLQSVIPKWMIGFSVVLSGIYLLCTQILLIHANIQNKQAAVLGKSQQYKQAIMVLEPLNVILSSYESYWKNYGEILYADQQYTEAIAMLDRAKKYSSNPAIYKLSAVCFEKIKQNKKALKNYEQAAALEPSRIGPKYDLMQYYIRMGTTKEALLMAKYIMKIKPKVVSSKSLYYKQQAANLLQGNASNSIGIKL